jgi:hypothetical protein
VPFGGLVDIRSAAVIEDEIKTIYGLAMGAADVAPRQLWTAFDAVVRARGGLPEEEADESTPGVGIEAKLHSFEVHGAWLVIETDHELSLALARELAAQVKRTLTVHTLQVREEVVENDGGEDDYGYRNQYRSLDVRPDGVVIDRDPPVDPDYALRAHGDFHETRGAILWMMVCEQEAYSPIGEPRYLGYRLPQPRTAGLPPRLAELAARIGEAGKFSVQQVSGQTMVRLSLPDGSRRMSRVSAEELEQLRAATGIDPS